MVWFHSPIFAVLTVLVLTELYLTADVVDLYGDIGGSLAHQRLNFALFCAIWAFLGVALHWLMPFIVAFVWSIASWVLFVIAASLLSSMPCDGTADDMVCLGDSGRVRAATAFAWLIWLAFTLLPIALFWHVRVREDASWGQGVYGRRLLWKDDNALGGIIIKPESRKVPGS